MAIIDRIKFNGLANREWLVYKHPSEKIVFGTQLIVGEGQTAVFLSNGRICDMFTPGNYTLSTQNLPLLQGILNLPFGGKTPFPAEIFYFNNIAKLDVLWGTSDPILLIDPKYSTRLHVRAFGQIGLRLHDCNLFLRELIGVMQPAQMVRFDMLMQYFRGITVQKIKVIISDIIINQNISALEIAPHMDEISATAKEQICVEFNRYGLEVMNFFIQSINFPDEDFDAINAVLTKRAEFELMGDSRYATSRTFDVYEGAANNGNGVAGAFVSGGVGLGAGAALGYQMPQVMSSLSQGAIVCQKCQRVNAAENKFCANCGENLVTQSAGKHCAECGKAVDATAKFCPNCGKEIVP